MEKVLTQFGLSKYESQVYWDLLFHGGAKVSDIARRTRIKRASLYDILLALIDGGFVNYSDEGNILIYQAEDPDTFRQRMHERRYALDRLRQLYRQRNKQGSKMEIAALAQEAAVRLMRKQRNPLKDGKKSVSVSISRSVVILNGGDKDVQAIRIQSREVANLYRELI